MVSIVIYWKGGTHQYTRREYMLGYMQRKYNNRVREIMGTGLYIIILQGSTITGVPSQRVPMMNAESGIADR